jgi:cytosine permease
MLSITANIAFPLFLLAVGYAFVQVVGNYNLGDLMSSPPPGQPLSMSVATTMVAGGFIIGAVMTPDIARFLTKSSQVFWMVLISTFVGELSMCLIAVLMAHAVKSADVVTIMLSLGGWLAASIVVFSTLKINDINLYSSSLGVTTALNAFFKRKFDRSMITIVVGIVGTLLSALGIMDHFVGFLVFLGIAVPPIAGIVVVDYYLLKRDRQILDESRKQDQLPATCERWNPIAITAWVIAFAIGYFVQWGIPALNSLLVACVAYYVMTIIYNMTKGTFHFTRTANV